MKGSAAAEKQKLNTFSISEIIKAKQKEFTSNQNSLKETNSALTKTKDYSKEDNILQNTFSGKFKNSKKIKNDCNKSSNSKHNQILFKPSNKSFLSNNFNHSICHNNNNLNSSNNSCNNNNNFNKTVHSKNVKLELRKIENILKYKEDAKFSDSKYCDSRLDKISNDKTNVYANNYCGSSNYINNNNNYGNSNYNFNSNIFGGANREKSKKTFSRIQHKFKRSSMSSKFLNLYLGDFKNMSKDEFTNENNLLTQINCNVNSLLFREKQVDNFIVSNYNNNNKEKEFENITMLNISDSYLVEDLDEYSRIQINRNNFYCNENLTEHAKFTLKNNNNNNDNNSNTDIYNEKENSVSRIDTAQNVRNVSINNITSKFNYGRNSNIVKFDANGNKLQSSTNIFSVNDNTNTKNNINNTNYINNIEGLPSKIKKNRKNYQSKNNLINKDNSPYADEYISCLTDDNQFTGKREDNTVVNLFNYLNFSDKEINYKNSNNLNMNFSSLESENAFLNSNNFNNNNFLNCEINEFNNACYFQNSGNLNKISSKSFKGSLSGISKITTSIHRNKFFFSEENNLNNSNNKENLKNNKKNINSSKNAAENKLSNISILSIKSQNSESARCSVKKYNTDEENNTIIIISKNNEKNLNWNDLNVNKNNSVIDMSYYASDVDEVF